MREASDFAKYFLQNNSDTCQDTMDGNMKLQKLLFFANLINNLEEGAFLFNDEMLAFKGGTVIEPIRLKYKNHYSEFKEEAKNFTPNFTESEYKTLNMTLDIFGKLPARELSELNHEFDFWQEAYDNSKTGFNFHDKNLAVIPKSKILDEIYKLKPVIESFKQNDSYNYLCETINGVTFYFDPDEFNKDDILPKLIDFSYLAEEATYTLFEDEGELMFL